MSDPSAFNNSIRDDEATSLHEELVARLHQRGLRINDEAPSDQLDDLLSALDEFESAVQQAGGDLFVNAPDSSQPERPEFVVPHQRDDESVPSYTARLREATERLRR